MNKNLITLAVFAIMSSCVYAQQITEQQAKERALQFLTDGGKAKSRSATGKLLKKTRVEVSNLYAYNLDGGGFVIVLAIVFMSVMPLSWLFMYSIDSFSSP